MLTAVNTQPTSAPRRRPVEAVSFEVKALWNITIARGRFDRVGGFYEVGPGGDRLELTVDARSIDTGDAERDEQLRSMAGADMAEHPQVRFVSTSVRAAGGEKLHVLGNVEAAGKVVPVEFDATVRRVGGGLELGGSRKVDERWLGKHGELVPHATAHVTVRLGEAA